MIIRDVLSVNKETEMLDHQLVLVRKKVVVLPSSLSCNMVVILCSSFPADQRYFRCMRQQILFSHRKIYNKDDVKKLLSDLIRVH